MASNFPGPFEIEIVSIVQGVEHKQRLNCTLTGSWAIGDAPDTLNMLTKDGGNTQLDTAVTAWVTSMQPFFASDYSWTAYTVWQYLAGTFDRVFVTTGALNITGSGTGSTNLAHQSIFTFRSGEGGILKIVQNEDTNTGQIREAYSQLGASAQSFMDFVVSDGSWIMARDTSFPVASLNRIGGQNESVFKKRYR